MMLQTDSRDSSCSFAPMRPFDDHCVESPSNQLPDTFDFNGFRKYVRSDQTELRELAAKNCGIAIACVQGGELNGISSGHDNYREYVTLLEELLSDIDDVQVAALQEMKEVHSRFRENFPSLYEMANSRLTTCIIQCLDFSTKVQTGAIDTITTLLEENLFTQDVLLNTLVPSLFEHVIDQSNCSWKGGDNDMVPERWFVSRVNIITILSNIACRSIFNYPKEWVFEVFVPRFSFFFTDKNPVVRKLSIQAVGSFSRLFGPTFTEKCLVPHLQKAIHDENFRVRKLCCDVFVDVAKNSSGRVKTEMLTPLFLHLLKDSHKTVYHSAIRQLGAFIATFADPNKTGIEFKDGRLIQLDNLSPDEDEVEEDEEDTDLRIPNRPNGKLSSFDSTHDLTAMLVNGHTTPNAAYSLSNESASDKQRPEVAESNSLEDKYNMPKGFVMPAENISSKESQQKQYEEDSLDASFLDNCISEENEDKSTINDTAAANVTLYSMLLAEKFNKPSPNHEKEDVGQQNNVFESYTKFSLECPSKEEEMDEQNVDEVKNFRKKRDSSPIEWDNNTCSAAELRMERPHLWLMKKEMRRIMNEKKNKEQQKLSARDTTQDLSDSSEVTQENLEKLDELRSESLLPRNNSNLSTAATTGSDTDLEHFETSSSQAVPSSDESASHTTYWSFQNMLEMQVNDLESYNSRRTHQLRLRGGQITASTKSTISTDVFEQNLKTGESGADEKKQEKEESAAENGGEINSSNSSTSNFGYSQTDAETGAVQTPQFSATQSGSSSYWQKRLDILHRSVQSVVHNGSALAAALPVSLRRLTVSESSESSSTDVVNNNSTSPTSSANHFSESNGNRSPGQGFQQNDEQFYNQAQLNSVCEDEDDQDNDFSNVNAFSRGDIFSNNDFKSSNSHSRFIVSLTGGAFLDSSGSLPSVPPLCLDDGGDGDEKVSRLRLPQFQYSGKNSRVEENEDSKSMSELDKQQVSPSSSTHLYEGESSANSSRNRLHDEVVRLSSIEYNRRFLTTEEQEFLVNSQQDVIPQELLELLDRLVSLDFNENDQMDINRHIAHSIPAIVYTFGSSKWIYVKGLYMSLANHFQTEVRETIAASLHEIASIIGTKNTDRDLLPLFQEFLNDTLTVQYGLLRHLYDFCRVLSTQYREVFAQKLNQFVTIDGGKYRARADFAEQLVLLVRLFNAPQVNHYISAFALTFATDRIAEVRNSGVEVLAEVLSLFVREEWSDHAAKSPDNFTVNSEDLPLTDRLLSEIRVGFSQSRNWRRRQSFGRMLEIIIRKQLITHEQFLHLFYNDFIQTSKDAVSNVRQHFCKLCQLISSADFFGSFDRSVSIAIKCRLQELIEQDPDLEITIQSQIAVDPKTAEIAEIDLECREYTLREASEAIYNRFRSRKSTSEQNDTQSASTAHSSAPRGQPPIAEAEVMEELLLGSGVPTGSTTANDRVKMRGDDLLFE